MPTKRSPIAIPPASAGLLEKLRGAVGANPSARTNSRIAPVIALQPIGQSGLQYELMIYGDIGDSFWGESVLAVDVVNQLNALPPTVTQINVRINSVGGSVADGFAIYNALARMAATKVVSIDGVAMSIASLIAMAGDTIEMPETALLMIHGPGGIAGGFADDHREFADFLDSYAKAMASAYVAKSGQSMDQILALLKDRKDHTYTGAEAKAAGFCDVLVGAQETENPDEENSPDEETETAVANFLASMERFTARSPAILGSVTAALRHSHLHQAVGIGADGQPARVALPGAPEMPNPTAAAAPVPAAPVATQPTAAAPAAPATPVPNADDIRGAAMGALRERNASILAALKPHLAVGGFRELQDQALADPAMTLDVVNAKALALLGAQSNPSAGGGIVEAGATDRQKFVAGVEAAIMIRAGHVKNDPQNEFRGLSLLEVARRCVESSGKGTSRMSRMEVVAAGFTGTSDFPNLLANIANKSLLKGWNEAGETFQLFTNEGTLTDFKPTKRVDLNEFSSFAQIPEGGEYQQGTIGDRGETIQLAKYGRKFAITREAIINDDLNSFTRIPMKMGGAGKRTVGNLVFAILTGNPNMSDGVALFHSTHGNLPTGAVITSASVDAMRVAMAIQKDPDGNATALNIKLANLIVPVALGGAARTVRDSQYQVDAITSNKGSQNTIPNPVRGLFEVIEDARLDAASSAIWYGCADSKLFDTIEVAYLDGQSTPYLEQRDGWDVDGVEMKARIEAGVKALDFRSFQKNVGP